MLQQASLPAERRFFLAMALLLLGTIVLGFSRTLYLRPWFPERVAGTATEAIYLWHGAACSAWIALLAVQVWLISVRPTLSAGLSRLAILGCPTCAR
jgi:hypothetical protein